MKKTVRVTAIGALIVLILVSMSYAHCEIPCGIYDDPARIELMREHIDTIERSMNQIHSLVQDSGKKSNAEHQNQKVRWIDNKENHADKLQHVVSQYFMTQRISPDDDKYSEKISVLHVILVTAMKCKQTVDTKYVEKLRGLVDRFEKLYMEEP